MKKQNLVIFLMLAAAIIIAGTAYERQRQKAQDIVDDTTVRTVVTQFGATIQKVSLSAPDALNEIATDYAPYASSSLIRAWQANRSFAPGRGLSSTWPSALNIATVTKKSDGSYQVQGMVTEVTSQEAVHGGIAAEFPVTLLLTKYQGHWLMIGYSPGAETSFGPKLPTTAQ